MICILYRFAHCLEFFLGPKVEADLALASGQCFTSREPLLSCMSRCTKTDAARIYINDWKVLLRSAAIEEVVLKCSRQSAFRGLICAVPWFQPRVDCTETAERCDPFCAVGERVWELRRSWPWVLLWYIYIYITYHTYLYIYINNTNNMHIHIYIYILRFPLIPTAMCRVLRVVSSKSRLMTAPVIHLQLHLQGV